MRITHENARLNLRNKNKAHFILKPLDRCQAHHQATNPPFFLYKRNLETAYNTVATLRKAAV